MTTPTVAQDKLGTVNLIPISSPTSAVNLAKADSAQNVVTGLRCNWDGCGDGVIQKHDTWWIVGRVAPAGTDYANAPIGSLFFLLQADSTTTPVINKAEIYLQTGAGWEKLLTAGKATGGLAGGYPIYTGTSEKVVDIRAEFSTASGDNRGIYSRILCSGASAQGEAVRAYSQVSSSASSVHGIHSAVEIIAGGSISGQAIAGRFTAMTVTGLTLNAGAFYSLIAETYNVSSVLGITDSAHIRIQDLTTYGMNAIFSLGTIVGRSTNKAAPGPYTYVSGHMTPGNCDAALRVKTPDGTFYIPMYDSFS